MDAEFPDDVESIQIDALVARGVYTEGAEEPSTHDKRDVRALVWPPEQAAAAAAGSHLGPERSVPPPLSPPSSTHSDRPLPSAPEVQGEFERAVEAAARHVEKLRRRRARHANALVPAWAERALDEALYCVIDLETTGTRAGYGDEILEVGLVQVAGQELGREFSTLVNPLRPISAASRAVHGIADDAVLHAPHIREVLPYVQELSRNRVLVFHNAGFDLSFLQRALAENDRESFAAPVVDTVVVARRLLGGRCGLGRAARRLGIDAPHPHRALPDARLTALLLLRFVDILKQAGAQALVDIPGIAPRPPHARRRGLAPSRPLIERLRAAIQAGESLRIEYRASRGLVPLPLFVRPLSLHGGVHVTVHDAEAQRELCLELSRIDRVTRG